MSSPLVVGTVVRSLANDRNATPVPSGLNTGSRLSLLPEPVPGRLTDTRSVVLLPRSLTKMSWPSWALDSLELLSGTNGPMLVA